ncbi:MAG: cysteine hydrolase [Anaerolineales bacterium]|nr:cysteine hydrolase [Anaerolineales bacterium]
MQEINWIKNSLPFLNYLHCWLAELPELPLESVITSPGTTAVLSVDVIKGFCVTGPLASPRVNRIVEPVVDILQRCWDHGEHNLLLIQDAHEPDAVEFGQFPPHCIRGTEEAESVAQIQALPFYEDLPVFEKNSIQSGLNTGLPRWLREHPEMETFIVVGDCTDLCTYQLAMHLKLEANANQTQRRVVVPANAVDTYDMPVETALEAGALPHDADLLHAIFLYHMNLNGIEVVSRLT